jgi:hypothetical protein
MGHNGLLTVLAFSSHHKPHWIKPADKQAFQKKKKIDIKKIDLNEYSMFNFIESLSFLPIVSYIS